MNIAFSEVHNRPWCSVTPKDASDGLLPPWAFPSHLGVLVGHGTTAGDFWFIRAVFGDDFGGLGVRGARGSSLHWDPCAGGREASRSSVA